MLGRDAPFHFSGSEGKEAGAGEGGLPYEKVGDARRKVLF